MIGHTFRLKEKIVLAILKAATAVGGDDFSTAERLAEEVVEIAEKQYPDGIAEVEGIQDIVEKGAHRERARQDREGLYPLPRKETFRKRSQCPYRRDHPTCFPNTSMTRTGG